MHGMTENLLVLADHINQACYMPIAALKVSADTIKPAGNPPQDIQWCENRWPWSINNSGLDCSGFDEYSLMGESGNTPVVSHNTLQELSSKACCTTHNALGLLADAAEGAQVLLEQALDSVRLSSPPKGSTPSLWFKLLRYQAVL